MIAAMMGQEDLAREVATAFLDNLPGHLVALKDCLDTGDASGIIHRAHTIKGASATVRAEALRAVAFEMEQAAKAGDLAAAGGRLAELNAQFQQVKRAMIDTLLTMPRVIAPRRNSAKP